MANANETDGNGAREKITEYFDEFLVFDEWDGVDHFLIWLYAHGFKVVPVTKESEA